MEFDLIEGDFVILENDNICCLGKVHAPEEDILYLQSELSEYLNPKLENEFILTKDDIYKDLRIRGYDYSGEFKKLKQIRTNDFQTIVGECEWNGNMVTLLDNLFQALCLIIPFRKLFVPYMLDCMRIDPKVLFDAIRLNRNKVDDIIGDNESNQVDFTLGQLEQLTKSEDVTHIIASTEEVKTFKENFLANERLAKFESVVPFYYDSKRSMLIAPGLEAENLMALPIYRKLPDSVRDTYEFASNHDINAIDDCRKHYINKYLEVIYS